MHKNRKRRELFYQEIFNWVLSKVGNFRFFIINTLLSFYAEIALIIYLKAHTNLITLWIEYKCYSYWDYNFSVSKFKNGVQISDPDYPHDPHLSPIISK